MYELLDLLEKKKETNTMKQDKLSIRVHVPVIKFPLELQTPQIVLISKGVQFFLR